MLPCFRARWALSTAQVVSFAPVAKFQVHKITSYSTPPSRHGTGMPLTTPCPHHTPLGFRPNSPARWQDGWAVKLPNPPPSTLGVAGTSASEDPLPVPMGSGVTGVQQAAAERGAVTAGLVGTVTGMLVVVSICLYFVLRKANMAGGGACVCACGVLLVLLVFVGLGGHD